MAKTLLIPTDFTVKSLNLLKIALQKNANSEEKLRIILVHGLWMSSSITEMLFLSKKKLLEKLETPDFSASCKMLMGKYEHIIDQLSIDLFSGRNQGAFQNYLEGNKVDEAYLSPSYKFNLKNSSSFDLSPFLRKSEISVKEVNWETTSNTESSTQDELSALFFNHGQVAH